MVLDGLHESPLSDIQVWPNPTNGLLHIEAEGDYQMEVRNILGQLVIEAEKTETLDLEGLEKGIYFLVLSDKDGAKSVTKIIKE